MSKAAIWFYHKEQIHSTKNVTFSFASISENFINSFILNYNWLLEIFRSKQAD